MALLACRRAQKSCWSKLSGKLLSCLGRSWLPVSEGFFFFFLRRYGLSIYLIFIWLCPVLVAACGIFRCSIQTFSCITWGSSSPTRDRTGPPTLGAWSLGHWTTGEVALEAFRESPSGPKSACSEGTQLVGPGLSVPPRLAALPLMRHGRPSCGWWSWSSQVLGLWQFEQPVQVRSSPETQGGPCWRQQDRSRVSKALCPALLADQAGLPPITPSVYTRIEFLIFL